MLRETVIAGFLLALSSGSALAMAKEGCGGDCGSCHTLTEKEASTLLQGLGMVKSVKPSPVRGLYELRLEKDGSQVTAYVDYGKKNIIAGQIFDIASRQVVTPQQTTPAKKIENVDINRIPLDNALIMGNPNGNKRLFVFTDPDCPFCGKLHAELKKLMSQEPDLAIYVKMFPLKMHAGAYDKARVILGRQSLELLDTAFSGGTLPAPAQSYPAKAVDDSIRFAESIGINSTPTLILPDGRIMPGFRKAEELKALLAEKR